MVRIYLLFAVMVLGFSELSVSQNYVNGVVLDSDTDAPIPYVNIGIAERMSGTVSGGQGLFQLRYESETDSVLFSAIGYQSYKTADHDLLDDTSVLLSPEMYNLEEIVVSERALGRMTELGYNLRKRGQNVGFGSTQLGTEIGGLVQIDREIIIYRAHFTFNNTGKEKLLFRVNLYEFEGGEPFKNLIPENILISPPDQPGTITVDLSNYNIATDKDILLSLEWVEAVSLEENEIQNITFRADRTRRDANVYFRSTSHAPFWKFDQFVKYHLGFYVTARQVMP
jgi:hypothetical protein